MARERRHPILKFLAEIIGQGLFETELVWFLMVAAACICIVFGVGYVLYQVATDSQLTIASLGTDLSSYFDSISINPDKWS